MTQRAPIFKLRGVKTGSFLLASIMFVSFGSILFSQPVNAESYLLRTARCLIGTLLFRDCPPAQSETPGTGGTQPGTQPGKQPSKDASGSGGATPSGPTQSNQTQGIPVNPPAFEPITVPEHTPIEIQYQGEAGVAGQSTQAQQSYVPYIGFNPYRGTDSQAKNDGFAVVQPSQQGWLIAGVAWYWWGAFLALVAAFFISKNYLKFRRKSVLHNVR